MQRGLKIRCLALLVCLLLFCGSAGQTYHHQPVDGKLYKAEKVDQPVIHHHHKDLLIENNVVVLGADDFDAFITHHEYCMIVFYTPWSHKSQELMPEYEAVALELQNEMPPVPIAKVDVQQYPELV